MSNSSKNVLILGFGPFISSILTDSIVFNIVSNRCPASLAEKCVSYSNVEKILESNSLINYILIGTRLDLLTDSDKSKVVELLLKSFTKHPGLKVIFLSSVSVYGERKTANLESSSTDPINAYGISKLDFEKFLLETFPEEKVCILRISNLFGITSFNDVVNIFARGCILGKTIRIPNVEVYRDFIHARHLKNFILAQLLDSEFHAGIYNFSSGESISVHNLATLIEETVGLKITRKSYSVDKEIIHSFIDNSKISRISSFKSSDFNETLVEYLSQNMENLRV